MSTHGAFSPQDRRLLPWLTWPFSLLFLLAMVSLLITVIVASNRTSVVELTVKDEHGQPLPQAEVVVDNSVYLTDQSGLVRLAVSDETRTVMVRQDGYVTMVGNLDDDTSPQQDVILQKTGSQLSRDVALAQSSRVPVTETLAASTTGTPAQEVRSSTPQATNRDSRQIVGTVANTAGEPVANAWVTDGETFAFTDSDGAFMFTPGKAAADAKLTVFGSGYHEQQVAVPSDGSALSITLELQKIRGIYYNPNISNTQEDVDRLIEIANTTEVNAIVVDIKEELVFYDTQVQFFRDAGTVEPILDLPAVLKQFQDNNIYTIARLVVFKDSAVAETFPYLALKDKVTGDLWRDMNGIAWVNPMLHELWDYNIQLAHEAATMGFDEIQYDYVRFPTDGDLSRLEYGIENNQANREKSIETFLQRSHEALIPTGAKLSADVFGYTVVVDDDLGIGQNLDQLANHVDYLSPMIYPSHWPEGSLDVPGHPNDFPRETVQISMSLAKEQLGGNGLKLRPWLQDFNMPGMKPYGDAEVRAQIDAAEELGLAGWLIWDPNNWYHVGAFDRESTSALHSLSLTSWRPLDSGYGTTQKRKT